MALSKPRVWVLGTAVLSVLLMVAAYFLLIGPKRAEAADLRQQTVDTQSSNAALQARIEELKVQFAELPQRQAELAAIKQAMPEEAALPTLVRDLDAMAAATGVTLMTLAPGEPVAVGAPGAAPAAPAAAAPAPTDGSAPVTPAAPPTDLLVSIPTAVTVVGDFYEAELFLKNLQTEMPRAFLVHGLAVNAQEEAEASGGKPATVNGDVEMVITGSVFVLRPASAATAAVPAAPVPAPAATAPAPTTTSAPTATSQPSSTATP